MADDVTTLLPSSKPIQLGRAEASGQRPWQAMPRGARAQEGTLVDALVTLGTELGGAAMKRDQDNAFYEGQNRILQASLEGTQKEELQRVKAEQPWYSQLLGPDAMTKGAIEQAGRTGAGKMFDAQVARLAQGLDADVNPEVYRSQVMEIVKGQMTGDPTVDAIFAPKMVQAAQGIVSTQMQKHLEYNAMVALNGVTQETYDTVALINSAMQDESGNTLHFDDRFDPMALGPAAQMAYTKGIAMFDPAEKPAALSATAWRDAKFDTSVPLIELGNTVIAQFMKDSGFTRTFTPEQHKAFDKAYKAGKAINDAQFGMDLIPARIALEAKLHSATTAAEATAMIPEIQAYAKMYTDRGLTPPADVKDRDAMAKLALESFGSAESYQRRQQNRAEQIALQNMKHLQDMQKIRAERNLSLDQSVSYGLGIMENAKNGNRFMPIPVRDQDGRVQYVTPTAKDVEDAYYGAKSTIQGYLAQGKSGQDLAKTYLQQRGFSSMEDMAVKMNIVDRTVTGSLSALPSEAGKPALQGNHSRDSLLSLVKMSQNGNVEFAKKHFTDERSRGLFTEFNREYTASKGNFEAAWNASYGRPVPAKVATPDSAAIKKQVESLGKDLLRGPQAAEVKKSLIDAAARAQTEGWTVDGSAKSAAQWAIEEVSGGLEQIGKATFANVPDGQKLYQRLGWDRSPELVDSVVTTWMKNRGVNNYIMRFDQELGHIAYPVVNNVVQDSKPHIINIDELQAIVTPDWTRKRTLQYQSGASGMNLVPQSILDLNR